MNKNKVLLLVVLLLAAVLAGAGVLYASLSGDNRPDPLATLSPQIQDTVPAVLPTDGATEPSETEPVDYSAPEFTVRDLEGNWVNLSDFEGQPVVLNFWASWCGPCKSEMPDFDEAYLELGEEIHFLMVNMTDGSRETLETAQAHVEEMGYHFPVYFDTQYSAAIAYGVTALPPTYFIDAQGNLVAMASGAIDAETLQKGIDMILPQE